MRSFFTEESAMDALVKWYTDDGIHKSFSKIEQCEKIFIDGGGSVLIDEPTVSVDANGVKFCTFLRHVPFVIEILKNEKISHVDGCIKFGGFHGRVYVITDDTRNALISLFEELYINRKEETDMLEFKLMNSLVDSGVLYLGNCSCQSGRPYKNCCGNRN
jgi:hypothetical protein